MVIRGEIIWKLSPAATKTVEPFRAGLGEKAYNEDARAFKDWMCSYFSNGNCAIKSQSVSPMTVPTKSGWKTFKVRWGFRGGKRGGFRFAVAVNCQERKVNIMDALIRKEEPSYEWFAAALKEPDI